MKEIPGRSAVDYMGQRVIHPQQVMALIHSWD